MIGFSTGFTGATGFQPVFIPAHGEAMPALSDEIVLNVDGFVSFDPAPSLRGRFEKFVATRQWSTNQVFYGDQFEPNEEGVESLWSFCFCIGLDRIRSNDERWREDIGAMISLLKQIHAEIGREIVMDIRFQSKPWYSAHIAFIDEKCPDIDTLCTMIERIASPTK